MGTPDVSSQLLGRVGTRPVMIVGAVIGAGGLYWPSRIPVGGSYTADLLPGPLLVGLGIAGLFVAVATAANAGVPGDKAELAAALLNASQWLGGALGLAIFTAVSTSRTNYLLAGGTPAAHALTSGFQRALLVGSIFIVASALTALRATKHAWRYGEVGDRRGAGGFARSLMIARIWASLSTIVATLLHFIVPALVYTPGTCSNA